MDKIADEGLADWQRLAVGHARPELAGPLTDLFLFDKRLARAVFTVSEPMLAQIRFAWWREELGRERDPEGRDPPDPLLASILHHWANDLDGLCQFIDGWEAQLGGSSASVQADKLARARGEAFSRLARMSGQENWARQAGKHGELWAYAEISALGLPDHEGVLDEGRALAADLPRLPRTLRALAVVGGLSRRALLRGGKPIFGDRLSPFAAIRLGVFGT